VESTSCSEEAAVYPTASAYPVKSAYPVDTTTPCETSTLMPVYSASTYAAQSAYPTYPGCTGYNCTTVVTAGSSNMAVSGLFAAVAALAAAALA